MRGRDRLRYFPCRLSLVPVLLASALPPDVVLVHTSAPAGSTVSLGTEVTVLPAAAWSSRSSTRGCRTPTGDAVVDSSRQARPCSSALARFPMPS